MPNVTRFNGDPRDAEILLAFVLKQPREFILAHPEIKLSGWQKFRFNRLIKKRQQGVPLAYLIGHKEFFGLDFLVNKHTLIPRPETEILVEAVLEKIKQNNANGTLIDIGTGTGCISIAIAKSYPKISAFATDISRGALRVARHNARCNQVALTFLHGNLLEPVKQKISGAIIITANLPYLNDEEFTHESSIQHEPKTALVAAENGLALYRELLQQINERKFPGPLNLFFEINPQQTAAIKKMIAEYFPTALVTIIPDLATRDRVVIIEINKKAK